MESSRHLRRMRLPNRSSSGTELLESRIAPATITPTLATYTDLDGDVVKVACSLPVLALPGALVFASSDGGVHEVLQLIHLSPAGNLARLTISATTPTGGMGDGFVNVGAIDATGVNLGPVTVDGDLGQIDAGHNDALVRAVASLTVHSLGRLGAATQGLTPDFTSTISGNLGSVKIVTDVSGASLVVAGSISSVAIGGSLLGGHGSGSDETGEIFASGPIGAVNIGGSIVGGDGAKSGRVASDDRIPGAIKVGGSILGGAGSHSGEILSVRRMGVVAVKGDIRGGSASHTGRIECGANIASIAVGGSVIGSSYNDTGEILGDTKNSINSIKIGGDLRGGGASGSASVENTGYLTGGHIGSIVIGGSIESGVNDSSGTLRNSGAVATNDDIGSIKVLGSVVGNTSELTGKRTPAVISGEDSVVHTADPRTDPGIGSVFVGGRVEQALIIAGFETNGNPDDADAKILSVVIGGDLIASNIIAGIVTTNADYGDTDGSDSVLSNPSHVGYPTNFSRIGRLVVGGQVLGTNAPGDSFGIEAQQIGSVRIGGTALPLKPGLDDFTIAAATGGDVRIREFPIF